jgi:uncharacterized membrane protein YfcA
LIPFDDPAAMIAAFAIIAVGYIVFGISGFGASLLTIPALSHIYPVTFVLALAALLDVLSAFFIGLRERRLAEVGEIRWLVPFSVVGAVAGVTLLIYLPRELTLLALGSFIGGYGLLGLLSRAPVRRIAQGWAPLAGTVGGATGTLFGMGGPPYLIYLTRRIFDKARLRATMGVMVSISLVIRLAVFGLAGVLFQAQLVSALIWLLPAAGLGLWAGSRIQMRASRDNLLRMLNLVLLACGLSLILRTGFFGS